MLIKNLHLFFGGAHEEETRGVEKERSKELEAVRVRTVGGKSITIFEDEGDLNDPRQTGSH